MGSAPLSGGGRHDLDGGGDLLGRERPAHGAVVQQRVLRPLHGEVVVVVAEVAVPRALFAAILRRIDRLRGPPGAAAWRERAMRPAEPRENRVPRSTSTTRGDRVSLPTGRRWLLPPSIRPQNLFESA